ncbi:hypothetical protein X759_21205 [Mesorhizobium sp. LSHC420B00]|nr:hypothetical protein X759_21205 [Mesorhizobium sp. LSHC420B00]
MREPRTDSEKVQERGAYSQYVHQDKYLDAKLTTIRPRAQMLAMARRGLGTGGRRPSWGDVGPVPISRRAIKGGVIE